MVTLSFVENVIPRLEFFLQSLLIRQTECPHCRSPRIRLVARKYFFIQIRCCEVCGLYFTSPIYKTRFAPNLYGSFYEGGFVTKLPTEAELSEWKRMAFKATEKDYSKQLQALAEQCRPDNRTLLEVGCSWGYFLYQADRHGFQSVGLEIDRVRASFGVKHLGVQIVSNFSELKGQQFDVIYAAHVLEHLTNLSGMLKKIVLHLKTGGKLIVEVPNFDYAQFGRMRLSIIGAVHPLGFDSKFFIGNLPKYNLQILGIYDSWDNFPNRPVKISSGDVIIVLAEKNAL